MKIIKLSFCAISLIALAGCSSSDSDSTPTAQDELQGLWVGMCFPDGDGDSERQDFLVSGNNFTQSQVSFQNSESCGGELSLSISEHGTFVVPAEVTELPDGNANHVDATYNRTSVSASQNFLDLLEAGGTSLEDQLAADGITGDLNNLPLTQFGRVQAEFFSIYRINMLDGGGSEIQFGDDSDSFDGSSEALRPTELSPDARFTKVE